ncbi:hypothetical protein Kpol_1002p37 [Vanderwaltozyma polyspora DSM 70294]|uniref:rRNA methyltransferase 2, mitochondrial n=1 Tax=Vanderwaltozyma polyspora (strain ATCC 22028 / DSM 70294 / BCRC 21397 / CBS 2163 / NBRC 10782 / NRRL Y-8283 / UCD 57-17) TaxID=436907 RepID=A7TE68_VANPO|nr:uncharacterized protein Kpol_1002p37 [Vanderwaltozyma polyspora DSM 70294]EDO19390.1 hypothetical protein Kpol_1002p37 [Vanderwaltozyma polyspora DSM 70294]
MQAWLYKSLNSKFCRIPVNKNWFRLIQLRYNSNSKSRWLQRQWSDPYTQEAKDQNLRSRAAFKLIEINNRFKLFDKHKKLNVLDLGFAPGAWSQVIRKSTSDDSLILGVDILPCDPPTGVSSIQANILSKRTHDLIRLFFNESFQLNREDNLHKDYGYFQDYLENELDSNFKEDSQTLMTDNDKPVNFSISKYPIDIVVSDMYVPWQVFNTHQNNITNIPNYRMANTSGLAVKDHAQSIDLCDAALVTAIDLVKPKGSFVCKLYSGKEENLFEKRLKKVFHKAYRFKPKSSRSESKEFYFIGLNKRETVDKLDVFTT